MPSAVQDLRYALRHLGKTPAVSAVAVLSLALGIGANTAIFGVINALLLRSLPVRNPEQLVRIGAVDPAHPEHGEDVSLAMFDEIRQRATVFSNVFIWSGGGMANIEANGAKYASTIDEVSGDYFAGLGIRPFWGRLLSREDTPLDGHRSAQVAVISYGCWQQRFAGDSSVVGKIIRVDDTPATIVGVSPPGFTGLDIDTEPEATVPIGFTGHELKYREHLWYTLFARLKHGIGVAEARAQIGALWPGILKATAAESFHAEQRAKFFNLRADVRSAARGDSFLRERLEKPLEVLMTLVGAVLLIACVNLANLLLARAAARRHEFGVRAALGAGRWQLIRMMLIEALLLSSAGAAFGLVFARWTAHYLLASFWTGYVPLSIDPSPDARVLAFAALLAVFTGFLFGSVPAWRMSRSEPAKKLAQSTRTTGGRTGRLSRALVTAQMGLSLVLLIGATLFVRSLQNLRTADLGYRRDHLLLMQLFVRAGREKIPNRTAYYHDLTTRVCQLPGVQSASYLNIGPNTGYAYKTSVSSESGGAVISAAEEWAGPDLFRTMGLRVLAGREFDWHDDEHSPRVAVVSESLAHALFPNQNPLGRRIDVGTDPEHKGLIIIGVVNSASLWRFEDHEPLAVYHALMQETGYNWGRVIIRTRNEPLSIARPAERILESLGNHYALRTETIEQRTDDTLVLERMVATLASGFSALALLLAAVGLYGVMSYAITQRTAEIGVRMAVGAQSGNVLRMILLEVFQLLAIGMGIALPIAFASARILGNMLFGVSMVEPTVILVSCSILFAVASIAGFVPARRASRVDPILALRSE